MTKAALDKRTRALRPLVAEMAEPINAAIKAEMEAQTARGTRPADVMLAACLVLADRLQDFHEVFGDAKRMLDASQEEWLLQQLGTLEEGRA